MHVLSTLGVAAFHPIYYKYHTSVTLPHLTHIVLDGKPRPTFVPIIGILIHPAVRHNRHGSKIGEGCALLGVAGSPSDTMSRGPRLRLVPSGILIHPVIWPRRT